MNKYQKEILHIKAKITRTVILDNWEHIKKDDAKVVIEVLRSERKKAKLIFHDILGDELIDFVEFTIRERTSQERRLLFSLFLIPILFISCILMIFLNAFGMLDKHYIYFGNYLMSLIGLMYSLGIIRDGFRDKSLRLFVIGVMLTLLNGGILAFNLSNLYS